MTDTPDWTNPGGGDQPPADQGAWGRQPPPPPGSGQQPPPPGWGQQQGWGQQEPGRHAPGWGQQPSGWGPQYGQWAGEAVKPGVVPLRPLGVGEILDGAITTMRSYPKATIGLSAIVTAVTTVLTLFAQASFLERLEDESTSVTPDFFVAGIAGFFGSLFVTYIATAVLTGMLTVVVGQAVLGKPISLAGTWEAVRPRIWALIGASLLSGLILFGAFLLCVIPVFYFWPLLSLATPALMLERQPVTRALRRSMDLVKPDFWRCFGILLLGAILVMIVGGVLELPFAILGGTGLLNESTGEFGLRYYVVTGIGSILSGAITQPIAAGMNALLYVDRRIRLEGLDVTLAAAAATA